MADDEFVDLDEIVPGTGFSKKQDEKKQDESTKKKEKDVQFQQEKENSKKVPLQTYDDYEETQPPKKEEKVFEEKKSEEKIKSVSKEFRQEKEEQKVKTAQKVSTPKEMPKEKISKSVQKEQVKEASKQKYTEYSNGKKQLSSPKKSKAPVVQEAKKPSKKEQKKAKLALKAKMKREKPEKKSKGKETNWALIAILILAAIIIGVIIYMAFNADFSKSEHESVVAVVNGQPIYKSELMNRYNLLKSTMNPFITEEQVLNLTITDRLLLQEAAKKGITTSEEEVNELINNLMAQNNIDEESLKQDLTSKNVSYDFLVNMYKNTLTINKLVEQSFGNISISEDELKIFYNESLIELKVPDMVQVRHLLFMFGNDSENATYLKAKAAFDQIKSDKSNFCSMVSQYSEDIGSKETCGEYNYSKEYPFVQEFIDAGFLMKKGEIKIVKTQLGYHIMYKVADLPGYIPSYEEVKEELKPVLVQDKSLEGLSELIASLQNNAIIEIYSENISTKRFKEITADKEPASSAETVPVETVETLPAESETIKEVSSEEKEAVVESEAAKAESESKETNVKVEIVPKDTFTKEIVSTPKSQRMLLAECLTEKKVRMFTASWSPDSITQLELFGEDNTTLDVVECDPESPDVSLSECAKVLQKKYPTWPTWQINGELYEGIQPLLVLAKYSGCTY